MKKVLLFVLGLFGCAHIGFSRKDIAKHLSSVVTVRVYTTNTDKLTGALEASAWSGTGFSIENDEDGSSAILTNKHVCSDESKGSYTLTDSLGKPHKAIFVRVDQEADLCLLKTQANIPALKLAKENPLRGEHVMAIGAPHGVLPNFTEGYVSGYTRMDSEDMNKMDVKVHFRALATSVPIYPGNSGSPVFDEKGEVVGIMFASRRDSEHMSYMVPVSLIHEFLDTSQDLYGDD